MGSHDPFGHLKDKLWSKEKGQESNRQFDSQPLKVRNRPNFLLFRWHAIYHWKTLNKGYNFALDFIIIGGLHAKLCAPKVVGIPVVGISGLPLGSSETKCHLDVAPVEKHRKYYKGKVVASPKSRPWWVLWVRGYSWLVLAPKMLKLCTNQLLFGLCKSEWVNKLLVILPNSILELQHAPLPPKCCELKNMPWLLVFSLFSLQIHIWIYPRAWEHV